MAKGKTTADVVDVLSGIFANTTEMATRLSKLEKKTSSKPSVSELTSPARKKEELKTKSEAGDVISVLKGIKGIDTKDIVKFSLLPTGIIAKKIKTFSDQLSKIDRKKVKENGELMKSFIGLLNSVASSGDLSKIYNKKQYKAIHDMHDFYLGNVKKGDGGLIYILSDISDSMNMMFRGKKLNTLQNGIKTVEETILSMKGIVDITKKLGIASKTTTALSLRGIKSIDTISSTVVELATKLVLKAKGLGTKIKEGVLPIAKFTLTSSLIVFAAAGIGAMFILKPKTMLYAAAGLAGIAVTSIAIAGLGVLLGKISASTKKSKTDIKSIISFAMASSLIVLAATGIGTLIKNRFKEAMVGLAGITMTALSFLGIAFLVGKMKTTMVEGIVGFLPVFGIATMSSLMLYMTVGVGEYAEKHGGWKQIGRTLTQVGSVIGAYSAVAAIALAASPYAWLGLAGFIPVALMATASIGITKKTAELGQHIEKAGGRAGMERIVKDITGTLKLFTNEMTDALSGIHNNRELRRSARTLNKLMKPVSRFTDILSKFEVTDDGKIRILHFDKDGKETSGSIVDIAKVSSAISNGFVLFSNTVLKGLAEAGAPDKGRKKIRLIRKVMSPVSKFIDIVSKFGATEDGKLNLLTVDENGKVTGKREIDISSIGSTISGSFISFSDAILNGLQNAANPQKGRRKIKLINKVMDPVSKFAKIINDTTDANGNLVMTEYDDEGNIVKKTPLDVSKSADAIAGGITNFVKKLNDGISKMDSGLFEKSGLFGAGKPKIVQITSALSDAIEDTLKPYKKLDSGNLDKVLTTLNDKHISYIDKLTSSIEKTKSPMREYIDEMKELAESYEKLQPLINDDKQIVLTVDKHEETNSNVNIDKNNFTKLYSEVMPMIQNVVSSALVKALDDLTLSVPKDLSDKGGVITTSVG